jgi:hypothetical protein
MVRVLVMTGLSVVGFIGVLTLAIGIRCILAQRLGEPTFLIVLAPVVALLTFGFVKEVHGIFTGKGEALRFSRRAPWERVP